MDTGTSLKSVKESVPSRFRNLLEMYKRELGSMKICLFPDTDIEKSIQQKQYQELQGYLKRLKTYAHHIEICGDERNSYSKWYYMRLKNVITWEIILSRSRI